MGRWGGAVTARLALCLTAVLPAACESRGVTPTATTAMRDTSDQVMVRMSTRNYEKGMLRNFIDADTAHFFQVRQTADFRGLTMRFFDAQGNEKSTLTARRGLYNSINNSLDARGDVILRSNDGGVLKTEHLIYDQSRNEIKSDTAFVYDSPTEHLEGDGFESDIAIRNVRIAKPRGQQRKGGIDLGRP
jgi:LPS export ABC transporter protein LptC